MYAALFERVLLWCAVILTAAVIFAPLLLVRGYSDGAADRRQHNSEAAAGVAIILRAAVRRVLRTGARNLFQTTAGMLTRTTTRAMTRRVVRVGVKSMSVVAKDALRNQDNELPTVAPQPFLVAQGLGFLGLTLSLGWILTQVGNEPREAILHGLPVWHAAALGAFPLLVFGALIHIVASFFEVETRFRTSWDGLLLQAYFSGANSYLPLTTDVEYHGSVDRTAKVALSVLCGLVSIHLVLAWVSHWSQMAAVEFMASMFLIFAMVYSFPLHPLDGYYVWRRSKLLWLFIWIPIMVLFVMNISEAYNAIL